MTAQEARKIIEDLTGLKVCEMKENNKIFLVIVTNEDFYGSPLAEFNRFGYFVDKETGESGAFNPFMLAKEDRGNLRSVNYE